jgi:hypothetical protein
VTGVAAYIECYMPSNNVGFDAELRGRAGGELKRCAVGQCRPGEARSRPDDPRQVDIEDVLQITPRAITDLNLTGEYAEAMLRGAQFPPVVVFGDGGGEYWLADGYHRWHAAEIAGLQTIAADVRAGGRREAILHSVGANAEHGWRRSNEDKRRAVQTLLNDPEWGQWSDSEIGRRCGVSHMTVARHRPVSLAQSASVPRTYTDRHGNTSTMRTAGIGRRPDPEPPPDYPLDADPRQLDIEDAAQADAEEVWQEMHRDDPPAAPEYVYDTDAARFRGQLTELIETLTSPR